MGGKSPVGTTNERSGLLADYNNAEEGANTRPTTYDADFARIKRRQTLRKRVKIAALAVLAFLCLAIPLGSWFRMKNHEEHHIDGHFPSFCHDNTSSNYKFDFDNLSQWKFTQKFDSHKYDYGHGHRVINSGITLRAADGDAAQDATVTIDITSNIKAVLEGVEFDKVSDGLFFNLVLPQTKDSLCLHIDTIIYLKPGIKLTDLGIYADVARLEILPGIEAVEVGKTTIDTHVGSIASSPMNSRKTHIGTHAGSIRGNFNLYDVLHINSHSGSIHVGVLPQAANEDEAQTAELVIDTSAGSVEVAYPPGGADIPARNYDTLITSKSGSIRGNLIHGKSTKVESNAGRLDLTVLPYAADAYESTLDTFTRSGSLQVTVLSPHTDAGTAMKRFSGSHHTNAGSVRLNYPQEWEGSIEGETVVGSLKLRGEDVEIVEKGRKGFTGGWVKAVKGDSEQGGQLKFSTKAGSLDVVVGRS